MNMNEPSYLYKPKRGDHSLYKLFNIQLIDEWAPLGLQSRRHYKCQKLLH